MLTNDGMQSLPHTLPELVDLWETLPELAQGSSYRYKEREEIKEARKKYRTSKLRVFHICK